MRTSLVNQRLALLLGLLYNLYGDAELKLGLVPQSVYDMQSAFYPTVELEYGVPLDTRHNETKGMFSLSAQYKGIGKIPSLNLHCPSFLSLAKL